MALKIGITENSDPSYDTSWVEKLKDIDGLILITKGLAKSWMPKLILDAIHVKPMILHCTCTGWGNTQVEPNVPHTESTMKALENLILNGFPAKNVVFRIDPIIPTTEGLLRVSKVLALLTELNRNISHTNQQITRIRISIMDNYKHVIKRFRMSGFGTLYNGQFQAGLEEIKHIIFLTKMYPNFEYSACAETKMTNIAGDRIKPQGCISEEDLSIMNLPIEEFFENPQGRTGCHCLSCKTEVLKRNHTCPHNCLYCYWKRPGE